MNDPNAPREPDELHSKMPLVAPEHQLRENRHHQPDLHPPIDSPLPEPRNRLPASQPFAPKHPSKIVTDLPLPLSGSRRGFGGSDA
jgi:hypothetical protein